MQALPDGECPGSVHRHPEGAVQDHPPVAQLVVEALHHQGGVAGDHLGGELLFAEVLDQVIRGEVIQPAGLAAFGGRSDVGRGQLAHEGTQRTAQVNGPSQRVTLPEGEFAGLAEGGGDQDAVMGDVLDFPARSAKGKDVAHPGLVDHLLIQFTHAPPTLRG